MGNQVEKTSSEVAAGGLGQARWWLADWAVPHSHADKPGGTTREQDRPPRGQPRAPGQGNKASKPLTENTCGG